MQGLLMSIYFYAGKPTYNLILLEDNGQIQLLEAVTHTF